MCSRHGRLAKRRALRVEPLESRMLLSVDCSTAGTAAGSLATSNAADLIGLDDVLAEYGFTGSGQTVVVIDSGIAYDHEAFASADGTSRVIGGWDFAENDADPYDDGLMGSHGTHVAGILAGDSSGVTGVASDADIVALRVVDDNGRCDFGWVEQALRWVHEHRNSFDSPITTVNLSLGTSENLRSAPSSGILEDELAQLAADGIFVTVAAGNAFASCQTTGLCYPAVSPYVVAVASVDGGGGLSNYSQRAEGVIAAPGRSIRSSVPDYLGNRNGVADDYAACSGTSMAAPLVAGASMLLREAYQFAGVSNVSQTTLYNTLIATADRVYDSVTNAYYAVLDIDAAIDSIMPADDVGSTAAAGANLGTLANTLSTSGTIAKLADQDWFSFTATAAGKVTLSVGVSGDMTAAWRFSATPSDIVYDGNSVTFTAAAGQTYCFGLTTGSGLGRYAITLRLDASAAGCLVALVGQEVRVSGTAGADVYSLTVGGTYQLTVNGTAYQFSRSDVKSFVFRGATGNDSLVVSAASGAATAVLQPGSLDLTASGYKIRASQIEAITVRAGQGVSRATLYDSAGDDSLVATASYAQLSGSGFVNRVEGFASVTAIASAGNDVATLHDSAGNDTLSVSSSETTLSGRGFSNRARYFDEVHAVGDGGGYDKAVLYGLDASAQVTAAAKKLALLYGASPKTKFDMDGFEYVRAAGAASVSAKRAISAIDFVLEIGGKRISS